MSQTKAQLIDPVDGTIVNADINASAAIAGSKISPDFGSQNIVTTGSVGIGIGSQTPSTPQKQLHIAHDSSPRIMLSNDTTGHATPNGTELLLDSGGNFEILQRENLNVEFFTNNSQRMTIDGSGNVGIGTTSPVSLLHIESSSAPTLRVDDSDTSGALLLQQDGANGSALLSSAGTFSIGVSNDNAAATLTFLTRNAERMRIDSSGKVGIGTTSPAVNLDVSAGSGTTQIYVRNTANSGEAALGVQGKNSSGSTRTMLFKYDNNDSFRFATAQAVPITFSTADAERMRIDSSGRVLIGTTTPGESTADDLTIASSSNSGITLKSATNGEGNIFFADGTSGNEQYRGIFRYSHNNDFMQFNTAGSERMRIDNAGRVLIGTTTGTASRLTIYGSDAASIFQGDNTGTGAGNGFITGNNGGVNAFVWNYENGFLQFATNNTERMRIDTSGRVLIGQTSGTSPLCVSGTDPVIVELHHSDGGTNDQARISLGALANNPPSNRGVNLIAKNNGAGHDFIVACSSSHSAGPSEKMRIDSDGDVFIGKTTSDFDTAGTHIDASGQVFKLVKSGSGAGPLVLNRSTNVGTFIEFRRGSGNTVGTISSNNTTTSYNTSSDYRLKENVVAISDGITRLKTLKPSRFNFKNEKDVTVDGFLAHEVTAVPEAISGIKDEVDENNNPVYQGIDQSKLVPLLVAAVKELITKVETLEAA